jgi:hypothetical protein
MDQCCEVVRKASDYRSLEEVLSLDISFDIAQSPPDDKGRIDSDSVFVKGA